MCLAERECDPSSCRASGLTFELPVDVVLVPPPSLGVVVTKFKLRILLASATGLSSRRLFSRFLQNRRHTGADVYSTDTTATMWHLGPHTTSKNAMGGGNYYLCFGIVTVLDHSPLPMLTT